LLTDFSADLKSEGLRENRSAIAAANDINAWLAASGSSVNFQIVAQDYALDTTKATNIINAWHSQGINVIVGPLNSGTAGGILSIANSNHQVLISPSSTAPQLAIPNDYLFRTAPNDANQGHAMARTLCTQNVKAVIIVYRNDRYGTGLSNATATYFQSLCSGHVVDQIPYDTSASDFTSVLTTVASDWTKGSGQYGAASTAMQFISFEEFTQIIQQANTQQPQLLSTPQPWYGSDGQAQDTVITGNSTAGPLVAKVKLVSTLYAPFNSTKFTSFCARFTATIDPGQPCDAYAQGGYDDTTLAALSILSAGSSDGAAVQSIISSVAANMYGVTGWMLLQASGDRAPQNGYDLWKVVNQGGTPTWVLAGHWDQTADTTAWSSPP
jgi:branched-chain amino acid transport system substrate-binding protein